MNQEAHEKTLYALRERLIYTAGSMILVALGLPDDKATEWMSVHESDMVRVTHSLPDKTIATLGLTAYYFIAALAVSFEHAAENEG